jgi:Tfp pilus assembly protein PilW
VIENIAGTELVATSLNPLGWVVTYGGGGIQVTPPDPLSGVSLNWNSPTEACNLLRIHYWTEHGSNAKKTTSTDDFSIKEEYEVLLSIEGNEPTPAPSNTIYKQIPAAGCSGAQNLFRYFVGGVLQSQTPFGFLVRGEQIQKSVFDFSFSPAAPAHVTLGPVSPTNFQGYCGQASTWDAIPFTANVCAGAAPGVYTFVFTASPAAGNAERWINSEATITVRLVLYTGDTPVEVPDEDPPDTPDGLTDSDVCSDTGDTVVLVWNAVEGAATYQVRRVDTGEVVYDGTETTATITGLTRGITYEFQVRATNSGGSADWSESIFATPGQVPQSAPVLEVDASCCNRRHDLDWTSVIGAESYQVWRRVGRAGVFALLTSTTETAFSVRVSGNDGRRAISYYVVASNDCGDGPVSNTVTVAGLYTGSGCDGVPYTGEQTDQTVYRGTCG